MVNIINSAGILGIDGYLVRVECDKSAGLPRFDIVGLPDAAVKESTDRVRTAIKNCNLPFPSARITVNLSPADVRKEGSVYDLPILTGLICSEIMPSIDLTHKAFIGELSLDGNIRPIKGALSMAIALSNSGIDELYLPLENYAEAVLCKSENMKIYAVNHVNEMILHLTGKKLLEPPKVLSDNDYSSHLLDFCHVAGQQNAKRALEISAAGSHNVLLSGSPGSGKSMMAKRISSILPPMTTEEHLEVIRIYSALGLGNEAAKHNERPFRSPHHTVSVQSLAGGSGAGKLPRPGEISLSHNGVLFLDEFPEFQKSALEILRQPIEDGKVTISRVAGKITYPSRFMLVCAMNPCKCGWYGYEKCTCSKEMIIKYRSRISGPILDRIDLCVDVQPVKYEEISKNTNNETSASIRDRVLEARERQLSRFKDTDMLANAFITPAFMRKLCKTDDDAEKFLENAFKSLGLTARSYDRVLRVSLTIADLDKSDIIKVHHVAEAISYRKFDRMP